MNDQREGAAGHGIVTRWRLDDPNIEVQRSRMISLRASAQQLRRDVDQRKEWLDAGVAREALVRADEYEAEAATIEAKLKATP